MLLKNKKARVNFMFIIGIIVTFFSFIGISLTDLDNEPIDKKEVKCYDKYNHEIINEICIDVTYQSDDIKSWIPVIFMAGVMMTISGTATLFLE